MAAGAAGIIIIILGSGHGQLLRAVFLNYFRKKDKSAVLRKTWFYEGNSPVFRMGPQQFIDLLERPRRSL